MITHKAKQNVIERDIGGLGDQTIVTISPGFAIACVTDFFWSKWLPCTDSAEEHLA